MNKWQKIIVGISLIVIIAIVLFPSYHYKKRIGYEVLGPPIRTGIHYAELLVRMGLVVVITSGLVLILQKPKPKPK